MARPGDTNYVRNDSSALAIVVVASILFLIFAATAIISSGKAMKIVDDSMAETTSSPCP